MSRLVPQTQLSDWAHLHAHVVWVYEGAVNPVWRDLSVNTPNHAAWLMRAGSVEVIKGARTWRAGPGEWMFPPHRDRTQRFSPDARILSVRFRAVWPTGEDLFDEGLPVVLPAQRFPTLGRTAAKLARFVDRHFPATTVDLMQASASLSTSLRLQMLFSQWFEAAVTTLLASGLVPSRIGKMDTRLIRAVKILDRQSISTPIPEAVLAGLVGLSVSQLNRLFVRQFGLSSRAYFERRRHQHASAALASSPLTIKEVAYELGFSSLSHFSAWFGRRQGESPRRFRNQRPGRDGPGVGESGRPPAP
ncbi:MAG TPA: AraC family transcriptional regulator [Opitutaceae bacterium]